MTKVGDKAPDFNLLDQDQNRVELHKILKKGPVLLVFYPADFTPVCTAQLCDYRDHYSAFEKLGVQVYGITIANEADHKKFQETHHIPFPLLNDYDARVTKHYGVMSFLGYPKRALFLIEDSGKVIYRHVEAVALFRRSSEDLIHDLAKTLGVVPPPLVAGKPAADSAHH